MTELKSRLPAIDIHSHFFPESWPDLAEKFGTPDWPWMKHHGGGQATVMVGDKEFRPIYSACWDPDKRLEEMDRDGIALQVLCSTPVLMAYTRPAHQALECAHIFNDAALELCSRGRGRLKAICQVPLQDVDLACKELSRAMRAGHLGVQIGNHVGDIDLDHEGMVTFLQHCAEEGAAVLVHPWDMLGKERLSRFMMGWTVGMPCETQLSIVAMILGGAFDRLPRSLRICFAHGGGSFAFLLGRLQNAWENRDIARGKSQLPPNQYLDRFMTDSAVFDPRALRFLVEIMGDDRVLFGTDYPFPLGELSMGTLVRGTDALSLEQRHKILFQNAVTFLGLTEQDLKAAEAVAA